MHNRHPVDDLADVRAEIRRLKERENELREMIIAGTCDMIGDQYEASVREQDRETIDMERLRKELGMERLRPFVRQTRMTVVKTKERELLEDAYLK